MKSISGLEDLAGYDYDYQCLNPSKAYYDLKEEPRKLSRCQKFPSPQLECYLEFHVESLSMPKAAWIHEGDKKRRYFIAYKSSWVI